jgi:GNAT superfamily N-acetyltransferase
MTSAPALLRRWITLCEQRDAAAEQQREQEYIEAAHLALNAAGIPKNVVVMLAPIGKSGAAGHYYSEHPMVYLDYIEVPRRRRRRGLGSQVMTILTGLADDRTIALALRAANPRAEDFFLNFGFSGEGRMIREPMGR